MTGIRTLGIDISHYSGDIDWDTTANQKIHFVFAKASELFFSASGNITKAADRYFPEYWISLSKTPLKRGAYHFCRPGMDAKASIDFFLSVYKPAPGDLLPTLDIEDQYADDRTVPTQQKLDQITDMITYLSENLPEKKKPIIYTKQRVWNALGNPDTFGCPLWVIDYNGKMDPKLPKAWDNFSFWRSSENKPFPGVRGNVDPDYFNGRPEDMNSFCL